MLLRIAAIGPEFGQDLRIGSSEHIVDEGFGQAVESVGRLLLSTRHGCHPFGNAFSILRRTSRRLLLYAVTSSSHTARNSSPSLPSISPSAISCAAGSSSNSASIADLISAT